MGKPTGPTSRSSAVIALLAIVVCAVATGGASTSAGAHTGPTCRAPRLVGLTLERAVRKMVTIPQCGGVHLNPREPDGSPAEAITSTQRVIQRQSPRPGALAGAVTVWLRPLCRQSADPGPPSGEPFVRRGPTSIVSGLFLDGGPLRRRSSCRSGSPSPGTVEVLRPADAALVARQHVKSGKLADIRLAPGRYLVRGTFANATRNGAPIQTRPVLVDLPAHRIVRRDVVASIP